MYLETIGCPFLDKFEMESPLFIIHGNLFLGEETKIDFRLYPQLLSEIPLDSPGFYSYQQIPIGF